MPSHRQFGHLQPKLWAKEGLGIKLPVWLPTTKSQELTCSWRPIWACNMALERYRRGLKLWFRPRRNPTPQLGVMAVQSFGSPAEIISGLHFGSPGNLWSPTGTISGLHFGSPGNLCHLDVASTERHREYYKEYGGGILPNQGCGESKWIRVPVACPNTKRMQMDSNQLVLVCDVGSCDLKAWSLPSLISELPTRPSTPF
jgi:hypothetical protein